MGASVAKWLAHLPFTSKVAGPNLSENSSMRFEPGPHVRRVKVNALSKVVGFFRVVRFPPTGKVDRVGQLTVNTHKSGGRSLMRYGRYM